MNETWLDHINDALEDLRQVSEDLHNLAHAFRKTGNGMMFQTLSALAGETETAVLVVRSASREANDELFNAAQQNTGNILTMALAMADKEKK